MSMETEGSIVVDWVGVGVDDVGVDVDVELVVGEDGDGGVVDVVSGVEGVDIGEDTFMLLSANGIDDDVVAFTPSSFVVPSSCAVAVDTNDVSIVEVELTAVLLGVTVAAPDTIEAEVVVANDNGVLAASFTLPSLVDSLLRHSAGLV